LRGKQQPLQFLLMSLAEIKTAIKELSFEERAELAPVRKDTFTKTLQWWKHLRLCWKRRQQRPERVAAAKFIRAEQREYT
jgi:hypothetical protein